MILIRERGIVKPQNLNKVTSEELAALFAKICIAQSENMDEVAQAPKYNKLYDEMVQVLDELRARPGDQRRLLSEFYDHMNAQVRLMSAIFTLAIFPDQARAVLQAISDRNEYPQAANARGILWGMDDGTYVPD